MKKKTYEVSFKGPALARIKAYSKRQAQLIFYLKFIRKGSKVSGKESGKIYRKVRNKIKVRLVK